jgi:hypothetical protein
VTRTTRLLSAAAVGVAVMALAYCADRGPFADLDRCAFEAVRARRRPGAVRAARAVSALAEPHVAYPLLALAGVSAARRGTWRQAAVPCLVVMGGAAARRRLSRVIARQRPPAEAWLAEPWRSPRPEWVRAGCAWACTGRRTSWRAGCSPSAGCT